MSARDDILDKVRAGIGRKPGTDCGPRPVPAPIPARGQVEGKARLALFTEQAEAVAATVVRIPDMAALPAAVSNYLAGQNLPATIIATAAIRYFMIKFSRTKVIAFDIDEALSFEGETGPYLQYAAVRARKILHKLEAREGIAAATWLPALASTPTDGLVGEAGDELWDLILEASRLDEVAEQAVRTLELSVLAKFAFGLAQRFNGFYHSSPVIAEHDDALRHWRAAGVTYFLSQMTRALELMGCAVPERM